MTNDEKYMEICFGLAIKGKDKVEPNPMVGAVVVYQDRIIGQGYHMEYGGLHAEVNAINSISDEDFHLLSKSTIYVSLEPCAHYGKTPPCVDCILKYKIPRVVVSCGDPNPKVNGKSIAKLRANGVEVRSGVLEESGQKIIQDFTRQFINLKSA